MRRRPDETLEANKGPAPRPPDFEREPFAAHSGKSSLNLRATMGGVALRLTSKVKFPPPRHQRSPELHLSTHLAIPYRRRVPKGSEGTPCEARRLP